MFVQFNQAISVTGSYMRTVSCQTRGSLGPTWMLLFFSWIFDFVGNCGSTPSSINVFQVRKAGINIWSVLPYLKLDFSLFRQSVCLSLDKQKNVITLGRNIILVKFFKRRKQRFRKILLIWLFFIKKKNFYAAHILDTFQAEVLIFCITTVRDG